MKAAAACFSLLALLGGTDAARAASAAFTSNPTDANFATGANWSTGVAPGSTATNNDVATFNNAPLLLSDGVTPVGTAANPIIIDAGRTLGGITFDTAAAQSFQIGTTTGNGLRLSNNGAASNSVQLTATVVNSQVIAAPITFAAPSSTNGAYTFQNNSTTTSATLTLSGTIVANTSASRPGVIVLNGTNTGANTLSGNITSPGQGQQVPLLVKRGTGTWVLSGANAFTGTAMTTINANNGIQVLDGVLSLQSNTALGTSATANANQVYIGNKSSTFTYNGALTTTFTSTAGGTLELANNITLDNGLILFLYNGGTIRSSGSATSNAGISLSTAAATSATLATVNAADVFTVGNATNDVTGGASDTLVNVGGPGTVFLSQASNYLGSYSINSGTLRVGNATALGAATTANVAFGAGSTGRLQLNGLSPTILGLNTNATTVGTPVVENGAAGTATLTVGGATASTYGGVLRDGTVGIFALTQTGTGGLTLTGANTYSGATTISNGRVFANNTTGSATGSSTVNVNGGALGGNGTITGTVNVAGRLTPGATGSSSIGNLTVGSLTLGAGSVLTYDITSTAVLDQITVTNPGGLTINGGRFDINGATGTFTTNGVYNLIGYNGAVGGTGVSALTLNGANQDSANKTYTFGLSGSYVTLTVADNAIPADYYVPDADGAYSNAANWSLGTVPNATGVFAAFGGNGSTALTANRTVTVDGTYTVGTLAFNSTTGFGYTLANGGAGTGLILNNGTQGAFVSDTAGTHTIAAPLTMTPNGATFTVTSAADTLTVSGVVSSDATTDIGLTKSGNGTLALLGANTYYGGTGLNGGTLQVNSANSLGDASGNLVFNGGNLQLLADVTTARNYQVNGSNDAVIDTNGHNLALSGTLTPVSTSTGGLVKNGLGTLTLGGVNTYVGATTINAGVVSVAADTGLGAAPTAATPNINIGAGTLQITANTTLNVNRSIVLSSATSNIDLQNNAFVGYAGNISGSGALNLTGVGTLALSTAQSYTGNTIISGANLQYGVGASLPGTITLMNGGTFTLQSTGSTSVFPGNAIFVPAGSTGTISSNILSNASGSLITTGDANSVLNINGQFSLGSSNVKQLTTGFTGTLHLNANAGLRFSGTLSNVGNGGDTATFDLAAGSSIATKGGGNVSLGALTGTGSLFNGTGTTTYIVGAKNLSTTFGGVSVNNNALTVTGTGTLTLTGANTYTGLTTVNSGANLQIDNGGTTGSLGTGAVTNNGTFAYNRSDSISIANLFSGSGTLVTLNPTGTTTFTNEVDEGAINPRFGTVVFDPATAGLAANALNSTIAPIAGDNATVTVQNNGSYNVNSGNLIVGGLGTGTLNVNGPTGSVAGATGGVVSLAAGLTIGNGATAVGTVNLNAAGTLVTPLINSAGGTSTLNLNGGTIVASGATGTFITGLTAMNVQAGGITINDAGSTITIAQRFRHDPNLATTTLDGGLIKAGTGILTLSVANGFNGGTTINAGTLLISANSGLGRGNVTIASQAILTLDTGVTFAHNTTTTTMLTLATDSVVNLNATTAGTVQDVVGSIVVGATTYTATGYYGSSTSGVDPAFVIPEFMGNGVIGIGVMAPVPEPSTWMMMLVGFGGLLFAVRRARQA